MDELKYTIPLVTFILGLLATPYIESLKLKVKLTQLKKDVAAEISDELPDIARGIKTVNKSIKSRQYQPDSFVHISLPAPINFIVLDKHFIEIYTNLSPSQRKAYKRILDLAFNIGEKRQKVLENFKSKNQDCLSIERAMLYEMLSLYYILSQLVNSKDNFTFPTVGNDQVVRDSATALEVDFPY